MAAQKIKQLRDWMKKNGLQAYIVPHSDRFQSEYLAQQDERLAWLTGFTGSAGTAIVTLDKAALFTDGRYTLQAPQQVDTKIIDVIEIAAQRPTQWLAKHVKKGGAVGFDPWLLTIAQAQQFDKAGEKDGWVLKAVEENPIDLLWADRPPERIVTGEIHNVKYAGVPRDKKVKGVLARTSKDADALLVTQPALVNWLLNLRGRDVAHNPLLQSAALIDEDAHVTLFTDPRKVTPAMRRDLGNRVSVEDLSRLGDELARLKKPVQADPGHTAYAIKVFCDAKKIPLVLETDPGVMARAIKNKTEIKGATLAHQKDAKAFEAFFKWYKTQDFSKKKITELDVMHQILKARAADKDFIEESFNTIAGFGPNGAIVHYAATAESSLRLKPNSLLLLDSGGQYRGGTTDITRTLAVGTPTAGMKKHYTAVLKGLIALSTSRFPDGTTGAQLDALARAPIWQIGTNYAHGTGHGVGSFLGVHEGPQGLSHAAQTPLKPGMILSIEPGIYITGKYGIRLENLAVVVEDNRKGDVYPMLAFDTLTKVPFESELIAWDRLDENERAFLAGFDTYPPQKEEARKTTRKTARKTAKKKVVKKSAVKIKRPSGRR